jgi:uncharacterized membrane protein YvbJ
MAAEIVLYGVVIHQAIARGDLSQMKKLVTEAEQHLAKTGDVRSLLEYLKIEIAKLEHKQE